MRTTVRLMAGAIIATTLMCSPGLVSAQSQTIQGVIISKDADRIVVRTASGDVPVTVAPDTKVTATEGAGILRRQGSSADQLMRGLSVSVSATPSGDGMRAESITFKGSAMNTARQIEGGIQATEDAVAANKRAIAEQEERLNNVGQLVSAGRAKVFFASGKDTLTPEGRLELQQLAATAKNIQGGYRLAVVGRADPTGNPTANKRLSARRVIAVKTYLIENCAVLPGNFVPDTALGESTVAQDPDPPKNDREARRVTVTIMVSKANASSVAGR